MRYRTSNNDERQARLRRAMQALDENTKSGTIDSALSHLTADLENKRRVITKLEEGEIRATPEVVAVLEELSTPWVEVSVEQFSGKVSAGSD